MLATGLKVGWDRGMFNHGVASRLLYKNCLKTSRLWSFGIGIPFLTDIRRFPAAEEFVVIFDVFLFHGAQKCSFQNTLHQRCWKVSLLFSLEDTVSVITKQVCQLWTRLTIEHFPTLKQSVSNESWLPGHGSACVQIRLPFCMMEL